MDIIKKALAKEPFLVLDGAMGTELDARGFDVSDPLWSAKALYDKPELIQSVHEDYFAAGADVGTSASYQATVEGFESRGFSRDEARELMVRSVRLVQAAGAAATGPIAPMAAASIGPYGAYLADGSEYRGDYGKSRAELRDFHSERIAILASAKPDLFACETIPVLDEALAECEELARHGEDIPAWVSFSCKDGQQTNAGDDVRDCARVLDGLPQVAAIGINCTAPDYVASLIRRMREGTEKPIVVYPNTGEVYDGKTKTWHGNGVSYTDYVKDWHRAGATLIGGCCRTSPKDIRAIAAYRKSLRK